jgi:aryl-alcohol dehydrogenase-like predicted oxidoreductase
MTTSTIPTRQLGNAGPVVSAISLGCMGMSGMYGPADDNESVATIHAALDQGINLLDTGDFYGMGHNEMLIGRALKELGNQDQRDKVLLSVKFGALRGPDNSWNGFDGRPAAVKNFVAYSLRRLGVDHIDIYRAGRLDTQTPIEDTVGAIADLIKAGYIRYLGLSEVGVETIRRAHAVHPVTDLQIEYSLVSRSPEAAIFPALAELGIGVTAYGVLSRGLLSGSLPHAKGDFRAFLPRYKGDNYESNKKLIAELQAFAAARNATPTQLAIAWVLAKGANLVPVVGARKRSQLEETLGALKINLSPSDITELEAKVPAEQVAGTRYEEHHMSMLDSEK